MLQFQQQFYTLLRHHANWWGKAYYFASRRDPIAAQQFVAHQARFGALADAIKGYNRAQFGRWLKWHQTEYLYLFFHLQALYPGLTA